MRAMSEAAETLSSSWVEEWIGEAYVQGPSECTRCFTTPLTGTGASIPCSPSISERDRTITTRTGTDREDFGGPVWPHHGPHDHLLVQHRRG